MSRFVATAGLAMALLAASACGGDDDSAEPDAGAPADAGPDGATNEPDAALPDAAPPDAAPPDAGPRPPFVHPPRLAFVSGAIPYLVEWRDGVALPPVALSDSPVGDRIDWSPDGRILLIKGSTLHTVAFDDLGALPMQALPSDCTTACQVDDAGWSPDGQHLWIKSSAEPAPPSADPSHDLDVVDVAEDGSFGARRQIASDTHSEPFPLAAWAPDSRQLLWALAVTDGEATLDVTRIHSAGVPASSPVASHVTAHSPAPMWCADSRRALFLNSGAPAQPSSSGLSSADLSGATPGTLTDLDAALRASSFVAAADCRGAWFSSGTDGHIYAVDTHTTTPGTPVEIARSGTGTWSPDSRWLVMSGTRPEVPHDLVLLAYDTTQGIPGPGVELPVPGFVGTTTWRDDSKQALFSVQQPPATYLVNVSDAGFEAPAMLTFPQSGLRVSFPTHPFSDDGRWLVYTGVVAGQVAPVYCGLVDTSSGGSTAMDLGPVSPAGVGPWAPDTDLLAIQATAGNPAVGRLQVLDLSTPGAEPVTIDDGHDASAWSWAP